jgi:hypothetical protein
MKRRRAAESSIGTATLAQRRGERFPAATAIWVVFAKGVLSRWRINDDA